MYCIKDGEREREDWVMSTCVILGISLDLPQILNQVEPGITLYLWFLTISWTIQNIIHNYRHPIQFSIHTLCHKCKERIIIQEINWTLLKLNRDPCRPVLDIHLPVRRFRFVYITCSGKCTQARDHSDGIRFLVFAKSVVVDTDPNKVPFSPTLDFFSRCISGFLIGSFTSLLTQHDTHVYTQYTTPSSRQVILVD